jgi:predicted transcriptional regulator
MTSFSKTLRLSTLALLTMVAACEKQETSTTVSSVTTEQGAAEQQVTNSVANDATSIISSAMDTQGTFDRVVERVTPLFESQALNAGDANKETATKQLDAFKATYQKVADYQKTLLQQNFSEQELTQISQFLGTDTGKKFIQNSAKIQAQTEEFALQQSNDIINATAATQPTDQTTFGSIKSSVGEAADAAAKKASEAADSLKDAAQDLQLQLQGNDAKPAETQQK